MTSQQLSAIMTHDHRECDVKFEHIEEAVSNKDFAKAEQLFIQWKKVNLRHFDIEETILFPETVNAMGMKIPPIMVMEMEHQQIKNCINQMEAALSQKNGDDFLGFADTCMIMIQQHNMKEEQILYPMIDNALKNIDTQKVDQIKANLKD